MAEQWWIRKTQAEIAAFFDVRLETVKHWKREGAPLGERGKWNAQAVYKWLHEITRGKQTKRENPIQKAIENEQLKAIRIKNRLAMSELIRAADYRDGMIEAISLIRSASEQLQIKFGRDAADILNEALDAAEEAFQRQLAAPVNDNGSTRKTKKKKAVRK